MSYNQWMSEQKEKTHDLEEEESWLDPIELNTPFEAKECDSG